MVLIWQFTFTEFNTLDTGHLGEPAQSGSQTKRTVGTSVDPRSLSQCPVPSSRSVPGILQCEQPLQTEQATLQLASKNNQLLRDHDIRPKRFIGFEKTVDKCTKRKCKLKIKCEDIEVRLDWFHVHNKKLMK